MLVSWTELATFDSNSVRNQIRTHRLLQDPNLIQISVAVSVQTAAAASAVPRIKLCAAKTQGELLALPPCVT